jgi:RimJ/RimL family protein N-acetyltransferase
MSTRLASRRTVAHTGRPASHWSRQAGERAMLRDESDVLIRPVRHDDAVLLADGFDRLGAQSRRFRFLTAKNYLSPSELRYLTDIDHHDHEALGALTPVNARGLGVARYVRATADPQAAEIAVTIVDEWQGRGLGSELLTRLTDRALEEGIRRFTALVAADNQAVIALLRSLPGDLVLVGYGHGALEYEISLARPQEAASLASGRASATG